ncbi:hypothetical protein ADL28_08910 [Streptomyces violaceusniger]|uniref:Uncharacterized protein n=1 Tax=Streptomyces violaceusniger TaxID=68280 RepID=A0A0X3X6W9_STRVO|nr:hypothetical protein ADL28_08910 [Streptomyces violaceusniger]
MSMASLLSPQLRFQILLQCGEPGGLHCVAQTHQEGTELSLCAQPFRLPGIGVFKFMNGAFQISSFGTPVRSDQL